MDEKYTILLVEDDYLQSYTLKILLESLNYTVIGIADSGERAIQMAEDFKPDLIIMDITLKGDMNGVEATTIIQNKSSIPVIYITGNSSNLYREKINETNHIGYFLKPITKQVLIELLEKHST